ncbi:BTB/POZ domain-containing protein At1g50280 [Malania oleifera]|uniref:BTB/POZ domain-containing protein At1g50280 n=1 Tax=Malania oleifera TaxID=397392 RepID=UPI0025AE1F1B|nr:BTB/POZ domain-containing protein At1g50280 [Malania oleifera]
MKAAAGAAVAMPEPCDLKVHVNGQQTFFLNQKKISKYSGRLKKILQQERRRTQIKNLGIEINNFPGGPDGFELVLRFCYNNGEIKVTASNVCLLHCCAVFLGMTEAASACNLLQRTENFFQKTENFPEKTENFLQIMHCKSSWNDTLTCLKSCEPFFSYADSCGLVQRLIGSLLAKISNQQISDSHLTAGSSTSSSSSSSSPETTSGFKVKAWWFDELTILPPNIIEMFIKTLGAHGPNNNNLLLTRFLLHYLKSVAVRRKNGDAAAPKISRYRDLAETAAYGVILMGEKVFSCRGLFWVLRVASGFGLSRECRDGLERLIGGMLNQATLDDLLVSAGAGGVVYDVNLVLRLLREFVNGNGVTESGAEKMKRVGRLVDEYMREIAPDQKLKLSTFLGVAESLPDGARDCFDGVYRAIDIYLQSHPGVPSEERSRLCRCLNYEKLTLEACKDLAKNPRIPPGISVQALISQKPRSYAGAGATREVVMGGASPSREAEAEAEAAESVVFSREKEEMRLKLQRMQWRVVELEKVCKEMKGQMSRLVQNRIIAGTPAPARSILPRLC